MNFPFFIARRYISSKKSHSAINIISGISVSGVALTTMALVCTLSIFNGFKDLVASLFTNFDPQLEIVSKNNKYFSSINPAFQEIKNLKGVAVYSECFEEKALIRYNDQQCLVTLRGVSKNYDKCTDIRNILYGSGTFMLQNNGIEYGICGLQLARLLGTGVIFPDSILVYAPSKGERISITNPSSAFNYSELRSPGVVFTVNQNKYDASYIITSLPFVRKLYDQKDKLTSISLRLEPDVNESNIKSKIEKIVGNNFEVRNRYEQQKDVFKIMEIEKIIAYLFLCFILLIACFNIIGSLSMLIIEKKKDVETLRSLGATEKQIIHIFLFEGRMITVIGAIIGIILGLLLCYLQTHFGLLRLGDASGNFIIDSYPVKVYPIDIILIFITVVTVGFFSVYYPVRYLSKRLL